MVNLSYSHRSVAKAALGGIVDEAVRAGRLEKHRLSDLDIIRSNEVTEPQGFVFPSYEDINKLATALDCYGPVVWLMRGCGLRIREALGVHREDFREGGTVLRVSSQATVRGDRRAALKHRRPGEYRDVPVPSYLWEAIQGIEKGPLCSGPNGGYFSYSVVYKAFIKARDGIGIESGFTPHSLRHAFASALLGNLVPVTDVATWLGHKDISTTYKIYHHLIPSAAGKAREVLDSEFTAWSISSATLDA